MPTDAGHNDASLSNARDTVAGLHAGDAAAHPQASSDFTAVTIDLYNLTIKYELLRELGRGGMAVVYLARERATGAERAIKVIHAKYLADSGALSRFAREARLVAGLAHPRIVAIHSIESAAGVGVALIMDCVHGRTVKQLIHDVGPLPFAQVQQILDDVAEALAFAHDNGIVHRDVKPENIFIDERTGRALLSDFGIARSMEGETSLTMVGMAIGTPTYMSPEQIDGTVDGRSDLYSLGLVGWEMLTGRRPWEGANLYKVIYHQKHDQLASIDSIRQDTPEPLRSAVERLLEKEPTDRWQSASEFRRQLRAPQAEPRHAAQALSAASPVGAAIPADVPSETSWFRREWMQETRRSDRAVAPSNRARTYGKIYGKIAAACVVVATATLVFARQQELATRPVQTPKSQAPPRALRLVPAATLPQHAPQSTLVDPQRTDTTALAASAAGAIPDATVRMRAARVQIATGAMHTCAITLGGRSYCWGDNGAGQVGSNTGPAATAPADVPTKIPFAQIALGSSHTCALAESGAAYCWGSNDHGQLGNGTRHSESPGTPSQVLGNHVFSAITTGMDHTCGLTNERTIYCWGGGQQGELGTGARKSESDPKQVAFASPFSTVTAGWNHTCALTETGKAYCWGDNSDGQLGDGTTRSRRKPTPVHTAIRFIALSAGSAHTCGLTANGESYCWGDNRYGQLGDSTAGSHLEPVRVHTPESIVAISAGGVYSCAITVSHTAWCWGRNNFGQLGDGSSSDASVPTRVIGGHQFATIATFGAHTCATTLTDEIFCWGDNLDGQLGDGTREHRSHPVYIGKPSA